MLYDDIGLFCTTLAVIIGIIAIMFRLPKKRVLTMIIILMIASACLFTARYFT